MDEIARAYATLGVGPESSLEAVRKRYKALVRKWHPDRFSADAQGQAEATMRLRAINDAFRCVVAARSSPVPPSPSASPDASAARGPFTPRRPSPEFGRRLTREEIDAMVEAMKNDGPIDWLLDSLPSEADLLKNRKLAIALAILLSLSLLSQFCGR